MTQFSTVANTAIVEENNAPAVSWSAIIAGATVTITTSWVLTLLGLGLGYTVAGPGGARPTVAAAIWMIVVQWLSAALGGFLTGRLRVKWPGLHTHEVHFRDTAHGFLCWTISTLAALVALSGSATTSLIRTPAPEAAVTAVLAMLVGAFISSVAAAIGGDLRDKY